MRALTKVAAAAGGVIALAAATPAAAQYYDPYDRDTVYEVIDGVARVAGAVAAVTQGYDPYYRGRYGYGYGYGRGAERYAADSCAWEAQRRFGRRYGRVDVDIRDVRWSRSNRLLVLGAVDLRGGGGWYGGYRRYDPYGRIAFSCRVRPNGRVTDFDTHRYDW